IIYDRNNPTQSKLSYSLGYFMEYNTTKKLVHDNFVQVLVNSDSPQAQNLVPVDDPLENCLLVVLTPNEQIIKRESVYANPDEGLKRVRDSIYQWNEMNK
ncbi:MAG: hypothetical protein LUD76_06420, partial [Alistipes sp.]|nr:hypothetical protein [Alistipes sp.]